MPKFPRIVALIGFFGLTAYGLWLRGEISDARWLALLGGAWLLLVVAFRPHLPAQTPRFNRTVIRAAFLVASVFAILSIQLIRIQILQRDATVNRSASAANGEMIANPRLQREELRVKRGRVFDRNGIILADTVRDGDFWRRVYPEPESAYVVGYYSPLLYGSDGLENEFNGPLSGQAANNPVIRWTNGVLHRPQQGIDLHLTLDATLQRVAHELLASRPGSVVLLDVHTGEVLVLASNPNYSPNMLFTLSPEEREKAVNYWQTLIDDPSRPLVLRATDGLFTPGSTFKLVTAATVIDTGIAVPDDIYLDDGSLDVNGRIIVENNRPDPSIDEWTLREAVAWSLNIVFAQVGLQIGPELMREYGDRFGFGSSVPFDLPVARSQLSNEGDFLNAPVALAETAFGQGELLATPIHLAAIAASFVNGGVLMRPYLVDTFAAQDGRITRRADPEVWLRPVAAETAEQVAAMMVNAVENGYAQGAHIGGLVVGGKTGTAELGDGDPHALFIGFVGAPEPRYAIAVVLEEGGSGPNQALVIGREVLMAAMLREP